jgi:hypothetical protein
VLVGGGLRIGEDRGSPVSWSADALFETGRLRADQQFDVYTATVGGYILIYGIEGPFTGRIGAGLRGGMAAASTSTGSSATSLAPWGWPLAAVSLSVRLADWLMFDLSAEGSYVRIPAHDTEQRMIRGAWIAGQGGFAVVQ